MLLICAPKMAVSMAWSAQWAAFGPLLQTIFVEPWKVQLIQVVGPIAGLLVAPATGVLSDQCSSVYGRRRPFIFYSTFATLLCWCIMMNSRAIGQACGDTAANQIVTGTMLVFCYIWMDVSVNILQASTNLIIADFAGCRQVTGAAIASVYQTLGSLFVSGYIWRFGGAQQSIPCFFLMLILVLLATCVPVCIYAVDAPFVPTTTVPFRQRLYDASLGVYTGVRTLPKQLAVYCLVVALLAYGFIAYNGAKGQYFGLHVFSGDANQANVCGANCTEAQRLYTRGVQMAGGSTDTLFNGVSLAYFACLPYLVRWFGVRRVLLCAIIPQMLLIVVAFCKVVAIDVAIVVLCAVTQGTIYSLQIPVIMHVIGYGEQEGLGLFAGAFNSATCLGQLLNFALSSVLVRTHMQYGLPVLVGGCLSVLAFLVVFKCFVLRMKTY
ncbi:Glycoside-Pentoside-Hexuronide (GPH):Cation Symporter Family [Achlya hypogyna]|uniref:Glycoside-Pentoside-Hexuronide (GPH):Cation Symporter Family n=1 Tax=Achlya hypogyna TaxID=1202772 RepID=A0A1V9Z4I1_ACHHY|nr:Glycoside-Pentoside-Hexuronide (GPH):Cation Symporter Family [Achlya hypogyna]